jgi:hypothetical protein
VVEEAQCTHLHVAGASGALLVLMEMKQVGFDISLRDLVRGPSVVFGQLRDSPEVRALGVGGQTP